MNRDWGDVRWWLAALRLARLCAGLALLLAIPVPLWAQRNSPLAEAAGEFRTVEDARAEAPIDLTGYWVSVIKQNWRFRMIVPGRGEYSDVPINRKAKAAADSWDAATEEKAGRQCTAYGAAVLMRQPTRLHIHWQDSATLQVETDNGMQTRSLRFKPSAEDRAAAPSLQGLSAAAWRVYVPADNGVANPFNEASNRRSGTLQISTDHLNGGLLRKNGIPYSVRATMREYWEVHRDEPKGDTWMTITTIVEDSEYLDSPYTTNSIFKKEQDGSRWDPQTCSLRE